MKRKSLFLSIICSVILAIAITTFTIISVIPKKSTSTNTNNVVEPISDEGNKNVNEGRDGSAELPYILYDADSFVELLNEYGAKKTYFELANDIDFANVNYTPLFNDGKAFAGVINGKGYALKNINIKVTTGNLIDSYTYKDTDGRLVSHVAVFGNMNGAELNDLSINGLKVTTESDVYSYIKNADYGKDNGSFKELSMGAVAGYAKDTTFTNVNVNASIEGFSYSLYRNSETVGHNAVGGVVAVADKLTMTGGDVNVEINVNAGKSFQVGGVAAYAYGAKVEAVNVKATVKSAYDQALYVGGVFSYARGVDVTNTKVELVASENAHTEEERASFVAGIKSTGKSVDTNYTWVAGVINVLRANDESQKSTITNVEVKANVDLDAVFAGVIMNVWNSADENGEDISQIKLVAIHDVTVDANLNVLKAYGYSRDLVVATVTFDANKLLEDGYCNIRLTGNVKLDVTNDMLVFSLFTLNKYAQDVKISIKDLHIEYSAALIAKMDSIDSLRVSNTKRGLAYACYGSVAEV